MPKRLLYIFFTAATAAIAALYFIFLTYPDVSGLDIPAYQHTTTNNPVPITVEEKPILATSTLLAIPFTSQAPTGVWDEMHKEACEEASSIMVAAYFDKLSQPVGMAQKIPSSLANQTIADLQKWENQNFGYHADITTQETAQMLEKYFDLKTKILTDFTEQDLKSELAAGRPVILPADGRLLKNPHFRSPGPPYHMIVLKGYDEKNFISNDPGTRFGENYLYDFETLYNANGDFDHESQQVVTTKKMVIVVTE